MYDRKFGAGVRHTKDFKKFQNRESNFDQGGSDCFAWIKALEVWCLTHIGNNGMLLNFVLVGNSLWEAFLIHWAEWHNWGIL